MKVNELRARRVWIVLGVGAMVALTAVIALRIYQDRPQPRRWVVAETLRGSQHRLPPSATSFRISVDSGQCNPTSSALDRIDVGEDAAAITVTAYVDPPGSPLSPEFGTDDCLSSLPATVRLNHPIGNRELRAGGFENWDPTR